jgi:hypothetical protein
MLYLVTNELIACRKKAHEFEKTSIYSEVMCGKPMSRWTSDARYNTARHKNFLLGMTKEDDEYFDDFHNTDGVKRCCLPKGHPGSCQGNLEKYYKDKIANKVKDAHQSPGGDDVIVTNRGSNSYPYQLPKALINYLRDQFDMKKNKLKYRSTILLKRATNGYGSATVSFDLAALLTLVNFDPYKYGRSKFSQYVIDAYKEHAKYLILKYLEEGHLIVDENGFLADPISYQTIQEEWFGANLESSAYAQQHSIQFSHVHPISETEYGTIGGNLLFMPKISNATQADVSLTEYYELKEKEVAMRKQMNARKEEFITKYTK